MTTDDATLLQLPGLRMPDRHQRRVRRVPERRALACEAVTVPPCPCDDCNPRPSPPPGDLVVVILLVLVLALLFL